MSILFMWLSIKLFHWWYTTICVHFFFYFLLSSHVFFCLQHLIGFFSHSILQWMVFCLLSDFVSAMCMFTIQVHLNHVESSYRRQRVNDSVLSNWIDCMQFFFTFLLFLEFHGNYSVKTIFSSSLHSFWLEKKILTSFWSPMTFVAINLLFFFKCCFKLESFAFHVKSF